MGKRIQRILLSQVGTEVVNLGYTGENMHTQIIINCAVIAEDYPDATVEVVVKPPEGDPYLAVVEYTDGVLTWDVAASDVAVSGDGRYQIIFTDGAEEIFRSAIGTTLIMKSVDEATGTAPTPQETWAEAMASELADQIAAAAEAVTPVIVVNCGTISSLPATIQAEGVTENYKAIMVELGTPTVMTSVLNVNAGDGTITLSGTKNSGSTTCVVTLIKVNSAVTGVVS